MSDKPLIRKGEIFDNGEQKIEFTRDLFPDNSWNLLEVSILIDGEKPGPMAVMPKGLKAFVCRKARAVKVRKVDS